jgi:16S rRNA (adenine1518-N6/adenine1519-N6)-dimethyltransferase
MRNLFGCIVLSACVLMPRTGFANPGASIASAFLAPLALPPLPAPAASCTSLRVCPEVARRPQHNAIGYAVHLRPTHIAIAIQSDASGENEAPHEDTSAVHGGGLSSDVKTVEGTLTRKERRRENRRTRNSKRNRLSAPDGADTSIRRNDALSQHFLTDEGIIMQLVEQVQDTSTGGKRVLELGPGLGAITMPLFERFPQMAAVELDGLAVAELSKRLPSLDLRQESLLDFDFAAHAKERGGRLTVIANVPFGISSKTLYKLLENSEHIERAILVLQQEVVNRVLADQQQRKYGTLHVEHVLRCERVQELMKIPAIAFSPAPRNTRACAVVIEYADESPMEEEEASILRLAMTAAFGDGNKAKILRDTISRSSGLRRAVPGLQELCRSDINWLNKKPRDLAPGKWLHVARSLYSFALSEREAAELDELAP